VEVCIRKSCLPDTLGPGILWDWVRASNCHVMCCGEEVSFRNRLAGEGPSSPLTFAPADDGLDPSDI
jgi:hypothetical protein